MNQLIKRVSQLYFHSSWSLPFVFYDLSKSYLCLFNWGKLGMHDAFRYSDSKSRNWYEIIRFCLDYRNLFMSRFEFRKKKKEQENKCVLYTTSYLKKNSGWHFYSKVSFDVQSKFLFCKDFLGAIIPKHTIPILVLQLDY